MDRTRRNRKTANRIGPPAIKVRKKDLDRDDEPILSQALHIAPATCPFHKHTKVKKPLPINSESSKSKSPDLRVKLEPMREPEMVRLWRECDRQKPTHFILTGLLCVLLYI
jgi:hypothetical protein